ncbi:ATP-dependent RNA helicase [Caenorhabditis elegans]|uniref:ATP-dependent RNA helicase n=1 Tax=Caenorhabditis elegans TaxID=6239 RepID=Q688Z4_CAEEL|nr:ATP-dependent RNA helicase [Caenorhabditis elegans]CCD74206.2 ATP-dependent RNA helicase [Caenorhabditis elegans]|eukprot:NP_741347.3 ATP-dependent RNA helicase [Caenorhabditis elegans]
MKLIKDQNILSLRIRNRFLRVAVSKSNSKTTWSIAVSRISKRRPSILDEVEPAVLVEEPVEELVAELVEEAPEGLAEEPGEAENSETGVDFLIFFFVIFWKFLLIFSLFVIR